MENGNLCPKCGYELDICEICGKRFCFDCEYDSKLNDDGQYCCPNCMSEMSVKATKDVSIGFTVRFSEDMEFTQAEWSIIEEALSDGGGAVREHSEVFDLIIGSIKSEPLEWVNEIEVDIEEE